MHAAHDMQALDKQLLPFCLGIPGATDCLRLFSRDLYITVKCNNMAAN